MEVQHLGVERWQTFGMPSDGKSADPHSRARCVYPTMIAGYSRFISVGRLLTLVHLYTSTLLMQCCGSSFACISTQITSAWV
jgi:hypothetical protein